MNKKTFEAVKRVVEGMGDREFTASTIADKLREQGYKHYITSTRSIGFMLKLIAKKTSNGVWRKKDD